MVLKKPRPSSASKPKLPPPKAAKVCSINIDSVGQFINEVVKSSPGSDIVRTYRGHAKISYLLKPSLYRTPSHMKDEKNILRELVSLHPSEFQHDRSAFDQLVRMQHYSLETRLMDVSFNPLVGLYFATRSHHSEDGNVVILDVSKRSVKYFDSDTVSCIANMSSLSSKERNVLREIENDEELKSSEAGLRLLHFIKTEKPYFLDKIRLDDLSKILLVKPKQNNRRILAQQGAFFIFGLSDSIDPDIDDISVTKMIVPAAIKPDITRELDLININGSTMFPEIESAAKYIMSKLLPT